jgi:BirA family transcriptional regulator, biotin operon repressor / biotin---[acetyl-CoA-carboxylase] ligase
VSQSKNSVRVLHFESLDSTNEEAFRALAAGRDTPLWIVADEQSRGRGRGGRWWQSPKGNLYATLLMHTGVSAAIATQLSFVAALATYDAVAANLPRPRSTQLTLKWPNDLLRDGAKLAGVLLESVNAPKGGSLAIVLGIGINVSKSPSLTERPITSMGLEPSAVTAVFETLVRSMEVWLALWQDGKGFAEIREAWLSRAHGLNGPVSVNLSGSAIRGKFRGIDAAGALMLETEPGVVVTVTAGDIYPDAVA